MPNTETMGIPVIDPNVQYVGVSKLRLLNADRLHSLDKTLVIQDDDKPIAVVLSFGQFMRMQIERDRVVATLEALLAERSGLLAALHQAQTGNTTPLEDVRKTLRKGNQKRAKEG
jgi:hypothetical protein